MIVGAGLVVWYYESVNEMCPARCGAWRGPGARYTLCPIATTPQWHRSQVHSDPPVSPAVFSFLIILCSYSYSYSSYIAAPAAAVTTD